MRALLLAAGYGTRLRPITDTIPKCLVPVQGRPLLDYWLNLLFARDEIERILVNTHYRAEAVNAHLAASRWRDRVDTVHEPVLLGTGGTILANASYFGESPFLVAHADNLTDFDLDALISAHQHRPAGVEMTMLSFRTDTPQTCGILELDREGVVQAFHEKVSDPPGNLANGAVYILDQSVVRSIASFGRLVVDLSTEVIPPLVGSILAVELARYHRDIGTLASLEAAEREFRPALTDASNPLGSSARPPLAPGGIR